MYTMIKNKQQLPRPGSCSLWLIWGHFWQLLNKAEYGLKNYGDRGGCCPPRAVTPSILYMRLKTLKNFKSDHRLFREVPGDNYKENFEAILNKWLLYQTRFHQVFH